MRSNLYVMCPDCDGSMVRISYWNNASNKQTRSDCWFICKKCNQTHKVTYLFNPKIISSEQARKGDKNEKSM